MTDYDDATARVQNTIVVLLAAIATLSRTEQVSVIATMAAVACVSASEAHEIPLNMMLKTMNVTIRSCASRILSTSLETKHE